MWPKLLVSALYGVLEGITEWLPISSTGHLILLARVLKFPARAAFFELFEVVIQLAAILAVLLLYFHRLNPFVKGQSRAARTATWRLWGLVLLAALPSAVLGLFLDDILDTYLYTPLVVALSLILYGILFILLEKWRKRHPSTALLQDLTPKGALWIGLFQSLALIPGTSRSGATVIGGLCIGQTRTAAAEFSFFLAIPTMLGAGALKTLKFFGGGLRLTHEELWMLFVGCLCAFFVSILTIRMLLELVRRHSFLPFGIYRILLGALVLLTLL